MTSRVLFCKAMCEDFRHKIWMFALSCLASFMAMPVFYLMLSQNWNDRVERAYTPGDLGWDEMAYKVNMLTDFFQCEMVITGGIVLGVGALIVGLFGFRYVFSKKMMDLYHSIPIKRKELFLVSYINGFLIWFVPMFLGALVCGVLAAGFLGDFAAWLGIMKILFVSIGHMTVVFLLFYHLIITAVMLCGNYLNTLLSIAVLGVLVIAAWLLEKGFAETYLDFYYFSESGLEQILLLSPIVSGIYQLVLYVNEAEYGINLFANICAAVGLWAAAFGLYLKRPSETAEQGLKIKSVQFVFRTVLTVLGTMAGWIFFGYLTDLESVGWAVFGGIFGGILVFGVLDIIFNMEFKAFYAHKLHMAVTVLAGLGIGFVFMFDLTGFDSYVPDTSQIADMGIYIGNISGYNYASSDDIVDTMKYTDAEVIHAFLEAVTDENAILEGNLRWVTVRVGKTNGKSYYRQYLIGKALEEQMLPFLRDESYLTANVLVSENTLAHLETEDERFRIISDIDYGIIQDQEQASALLKAYNRDVLENPDTIIYQNERILATISADNWNVENRSSENFYDFELDIYEGMEHTITLLRELGYEKLLQGIPAEAVTEIQMTAYPESIDQSLEEIFGLEGASKVYASEVQETYSIDAEKTSEAQSLYRNTASFTKREDIEALLEIIYFRSPSGGRSVFSDGYCDNVSIHVKLEDGSEEFVKLKKGTMPRTLLEQFEAAEE